MRGDPNLQIVWADGAFRGGSSDFPPRAKGMIWSNSPIYYAANVVVEYNQYTIHTAGCHGLNEKQLEIVEQHLQTLGLIPWEKEK